MASFEAAWAALLEHGPIRRVPPPVPMSGATCSATDLYRQQFTADTSAGVDWLDLFGFRFEFKGLASLQACDLVADHPHHLAGR
ncbi:hypothetical protein [Longispora urticae]